MNKAIKISTEGSASPSATELAYEHIRRAVMSGELKAKDRIKEELIAEAIGVSRTPIRHALQKLAAQGFIVMMHHHGARVADWSAQDLSEITDLRAQLESFGASLAAQKILDEEIAELEQLADRMEMAAEAGKSQDLAAITELNSKFHMLILGASGNRRLVEVIGNLAHPLLVQRQFSNFNEARLWRSMAHHREIIDALKASDPDWAASIMRSHILASKTGTQPE